MRMTRISLLGTALLLLMAGAAEANQPPGPQLLLAEIALLPLMIFLSLAGGAYAVLRSLRPVGKRSHAWLKCLGAILAILLSGATGGIALLVAVLFAVLGLQRGVQMIRWGLRARGLDGRPAYLLGANPRRLLPAGIALVAVTTLLLGMAVAFATYWPMGDANRQRALRDFVAYQLAVSRQAQAKTVRARFHRLEAAGPQENKCAAAFRLPRGGQIEYAPDGTGFTVLLLPQTRFPFFPYNYLTSQPSYRADGTGQIRMIEVHDRNTVCPPDGPVVAEVSEEEIERMQRLLAGLGDCP